MHKLVQLVLDLFEPAPPPAAPDLKAVHTAATNTEPAQTLDQVLSAAQFVHPRANKRIALAHTEVAYAFKRSRRRTIGMVVGPDGLEVSAPRWVGWPEIEAALHEKSNWIVRKLADMQARERRMAETVIDWREGAVLPFLGEEVVLVLDPRHQHQGPGAMLQRGDDALPGVARHSLHIGLPHTATAEQLRDATQAWLMRQAKRIFTERLNHFAPQLGVSWSRLSLSSASTRWGSASANGAIRLNWRLVHFKMDVIDYVVAHELSHLQVMDHSPRFWDTVRSVMPDYAQRRAQLKDESIPRWH